MTETEFVAAVRSNANNEAILTRLPALGLPDAWLVASALFQTVWNVMTKRDPSHGIKDYDIIYFDVDTSWDAEDGAIERARALFANLPAPIDVRNQARVHLWYEEKFGVPYPPLTRATDAIDRFLSRNAQVGIRPSGSGYVVYAPHGFDDIVEMRVRPNRTPNFRQDLFARKSRRLKSLWPESTIVKMAAPFIAFDHVQLAMPPDREGDARAFYVSVCGMTELPKPAELTKRGGAWFASGELQLHLGVEPDFRPSAKAHPALRCADLDGLLGRLRTAGYDVREDASGPGSRRAFVNDPFGNRIELIPA